MVSGVDYNCCNSPCSQGMLQSSFENRIFQQNPYRIRQDKIRFASMSGEMCPVRLCFSILPDASGIIEAGSWRNPIRGAWWHSALFVTRHAGFRSENCGIGGLF